MPNSEHSAGNSGPACPLQSGLSSPVLLCMQEACLGRAELLQLKITGRRLLKKNTQPSRFPPFYASLAGHAEAIV